MGIGASPVIASGTEIAPADRERWLAERRLGIGASEAAAALGLSPFETPRGLWARKLGLQPERDETESMEIGTLMEPVISALYTRRTGRKIHLVQQFLRSEFRGVPLFATLDAVDEEFQPVEFKNLSAWKAGQVEGRDQDGDPERDRLPDHWIIQGHQQAHLMHAPRVHFAILVGGNRFVLRTMERDDALIRNMLPRLFDFWRCVERREAPPAVAADLPLLTALHPGAEGEVDLGEEALAAACDYEHHRAMARAAEDEKAAARARLLELLGGAAVGVLPDGRRLKRAVIEHPESTRAVRAYREVRLTIQKAKEGGS